MDDVHTGQRQRQRGAPAPATLVAIAGRLGILANTVAGVVFLGRVIGQALGLVEEQIFLGDVVLLGARAEAVVEQQPDLLEQRALLRRPRGLLLGELGLEAFDQSELFVEFAL